MHSVLHMNIKNFLTKKISLMRQLKKRDPFDDRREMKSAFISKRDQAFVVPVQRIPGMCS